MPGSPVLITVCVSWLGIWIIVIEVIAGQRVLGVEWDVKGLWQAMEQGQILPLPLPCPAPARLT